MLVVDDDDNARRFLTVALEENGYEAITAEAGVLEEDDAQAEGDTFKSPFDSLREGLRRGIVKMREEGIIKPEQFIDKPIDPEELIESVKAIIG